jgi:hypothetical protein
LGEGLGWQAKVVENFLGGLGLCDHREELAATAAAIAMSTSIAKTRRRSDAQSSREREGGGVCGEVVSDGAVGVGDGRFEWLGTIRARCLLCGAKTPW